MSTFGDLERAFADLYPYRWAFAAGFFVFMAAVSAYAYRKDWHRFLWSYRVRAGIIATPALAVTLWLGWSLGSPLFTNTTVDEEFPFAFTATVPSDMEIEDVESIMAGMAKLESAVSEEMPAMLAKAPGGSVEIRVTSAIGTATGARAGVTGESPGVEVFTPVPPTPKTLTATPAPTEVLAPAGPVVLKVGEFEDADGFHKGTGSATIYLGPDGSRLLRLEDFKVTNGPELHVVLSPYGGLDEDRSRLMAPGWIDLGKLKGNIGNQNYSIPDGVDIGIHNSVTIWCKPFNVIFSVAVLRSAS